MRVKFWGTRGSLPVSLDAAGVRAKIARALQEASGRTFEDESAIERFIDERLDFPTRHSYGGNTSCIEIVADVDDYVLCYLGSGARVVGNAMLKRFGPCAPQTYNIFMSHVNWDHIMGFPFFVPAYIPGNKVRIHGCHDVIEEALRRQNSAPCFPVPFDVLGADIEFIRLDVGKRYEIGGLGITTLLQAHSGDSYSYRFEQDGKSVIYATDAEHKLVTAQETDPVVEFFRDADLVIFDAMYALADAVSVKEDWGHSSNIVGVDLCHQARAKHYCMFHHEPMYDDEMIHRVLQETIRYEELMREDHALRISTAYDGLEIQV